MSKASLEVVFDIGADEAVLNGLKTLLTESDSALAQSLISLVHEKLSGLEGVEEVDIKIPVDRITVRTSFDGGLNAQEWLEKEDVIDETLDVIDETLQEQIEEQGFQD